METKGEYKPSYLDYQTYLSYQPNKRWKLDFIGYISDNHYNFEPSDRETTFGTMENVKSFKVFFDGQEKTASSPTSEPSASPATSPTTPASRCWVVPSIPRNRRNMIFRDNIGSTRPRPRRTWV